MTQKSKAMIWAAIIIAAAITSVMLGLSQSASMGIVGGLSGAAIGALQTDIGSDCTWGRGHLQ